MRTIERWEQKIKPGTIDNFPPRIKKDVNRLPFPKELPDPSKSYFITGKVNTGKTILSYQMAVNVKKELWLNRVDGEILAVSAPDLTSKIKNSWSDISGENWQERFENCELLLIDDFGVNKPSDWFLEVLYQIINHRYDYEKRTILTSNKSLEEIAILFGDDRITSRIERSYVIIEKQPY